MGFQRIDENNNTNSRSRLSTPYTPGAAAIVTTTSGKQYSLGRDEMNWIQNRYKQDGANTYGLDVADQQAKANGQLSAKMLSTYGNSNVDRQLAELGLPSEKNLEKYLEGYQKWHTGGMDQYFSQMNLPKNYWTNVKGWYQSDMQNAYENTAEDQQRKARGLMPEKWEAKYTDTEIDDQLRARGLPPISEFNTYRDRWNNYTGIENFYANVALADTNLRLQGINDDDKEYSIKDPQTGEVIKTGIGKDLYAESFHNELKKTNEDGSYVYGNIMSMFQNRAKPSSATPSGDYAYDLGAEIVAANKEAASDEDYANYNAFSYDDYKSKADGYYDKYWKDAMLANGQKVSDAIAIRERDANEAAVKEYYAVDGPKEAVALADQYRKDYPDNSYEQMFLDMKANAVSDQDAYTAMRSIQKEAKKNNGKGGYFDVSNAFAKVYGGVWSNVSNSDAPIPDAAKPITDEQRDAQAEKDKVKAAQQYSRAVMNGDSEALTIANDRAKFLGYDSPEAMTAALKEDRSDDFVQAVRDALAVYDSAMVAYKDAANTGAPQATAHEPVDKALKALNALGFKSNYDAQRYVGGAREANPQKWVREQGDRMDAEVDALIKKYGEDPDTIDSTKSAIEDALFGEGNAPANVKVDAASALAVEYDDALTRQDRDALYELTQDIRDLGFNNREELGDWLMGTKSSKKETNPLNLDVDGVIKILDTVAAESWTNPTAMRIALQDLGFIGDNFSGVADDLTYGWSDADKQKLAYYLGGSKLTNRTYEDVIPGFNRAEGDTIGDTWADAGIAQDKQKTDPERFSLSLQWVQQQVAAGNMTEEEGYQLLAAKGYQDEMDAYIPEEWHKAHFIENTAPVLYAQEAGPTATPWEELSVEAQQRFAQAAWNALSDEEKATMYREGWWEYDPSVYRTHGQALSQQIRGILPGFITELIKTPVTVADAIGAQLTGRPEMWDATQKLMAVQEGIGRLGAVSDNVNGAKIAAMATDAVQELLRMEVYGSIGGIVGEAFTGGTKIGGAIAKVAESTASPKVVRKAADMFLGMVGSSPFMVSAFAGNYSEAKALGASNGEAAWYGMITGMSEGILEGFEFDQLWGKALGQNRFGKLLLDGKNTFLQELGIVAQARLASMAVSGLGEWTEESIGYCLETFLKMRHSDTWGKGTEWSVNDWLEQAMMGFITGALGGGIHTLGSINKQTLIRDYAMSDKAVMKQVFPDVFIANEFAETLPAGVLETYRNGGATVMSGEAYGGVLDAVNSCLESAKNRTKAFQETQAAEDLKLNNRLIELNGYAAEVNSMNVNDSDSVSKFMNLCADKLGIRVDLNQPIRPQVQAAFRARIDDAVKAHDTAIAAAQVSTESALKQSENELKSLQKKIQEHYVGIYLMSERGIIYNDPNEVVSAVSKAYMDGAKYEPEQATEQQPETPSKLSEAEANDTMAEAEQAANTPEDAETKAREIAYNRVYKDQEVGKRYAAEKGTSGSKMTRVQFAENERQNFQAKTTAKLRRVTLELAGLEAKEGMSAKEIFDEAKKAMTPEAAQKLDMYQKLSKALGLNMVVRDVVAGTSGYVHDGKLYVMLNGKQSMLRVASHELTHYMKDHASAQYDALRTHLVNEVGQERFDQMLAEKAQEYGLDLNDAKARLEADDEVCAELCEKMLENKDALERFVESDMAAAKTLKARLGKTLVAIKSAIRSLGTSDAETKADYIKEQQTIEAWYKGLSDAIDNANKAKQTTTTEAAPVETVTDTTEAQPQASPTEANPDLFMGEEDTRREQLRAELQELAKKGTRVNGLSYQEVNDVLDRVIQGDKSNYSKADYAQIRGMLAQLIPEVQAMVNGDENVDIDTLNERVTAALDYMLERYSEGSEDYYDLRELIPNKIALSEAAYNELRDKDMTLREASNELRKALGGKFVSFVYKKSPNYDNAMTIDELWGRIIDAYGEPDGYGNVQEDALALIDYAKDRNTRTSFDDLYGSQREDVVNAQVGEFIDAVQSMVEGKNAEQDGNVRHSLYEFPDGTRYVEIDQEQDRFAGKDPSEYPKIAKEIITDKFLQKVIGIDNPAFVNSASRGEYAHPSKRGLQQDLYDAKMQAAGELDNLVDAGRNPRSGKDGEYGHYHKNVTGGYDYTDAIFKIGDRYFEGVVNIENNKNGRRFKDITKIKDVTQDILSSYGENPKSQFLRTSSMGIKSQPDTTVNPPTNFSLDDDYMPLAERYDAGIATDEEIAEMQRDVNEAAEAAGFPATQYDPVIYDANGNVVPLSERFSQDFAGNRYTVDDDLDELVKKYGAMEQGREPRARDVQVPRQTNDMNRVSQWVRSLIESGKLTDDQAQNVMRMVVEQDYGTYIPTGQEERMQEARDYIAERQPLQAQQEFHDMIMQGKFGVKTNALGLQLLSDASARGDIASVLDIAADLQLAATEAGQSAQIFNVLKELKGVGSAWYMQKVIDRMNSKYATEIKNGKMQKISVDPALMADLAKATTVDQIAKAEEAVAKDVARQLPLTWADRLSSWRYFSMLANPTTHIRNITGNLLMKGLNTAKDAVATGLENVLGIDQGDRAHAILTQADKNTWGNWAQQSYEEQARNLSGGGKLGFESFVKQNMRSFDTKFLNALAKFNFNALEGEDIAFIRPAYKNALMQYMKAQGYTMKNGQAGKVDAKGEFHEISKAEMNAAIDWASNQAWKATFRDASSLATLLNKISKENAVSRLLIEGVMPFKKTPVNIAKRGVEYSPAGIIMGIAQLANGVKKGKVTTAQAIDNLASGITGTALMALGVMLAKMGVIRAGGEKDKKLETFLEDTGDQTYAMKFGDKSINMSSIAPATIPLFMGVALNEMIEQGGDSIDLSTITDTIAGTLNPFMEMSFMSSLNSALKNYNNNGIGGALGNTLLTAAENYGSQYLPTLGSKIAQFLDPTRRTTKSDATSKVGGNMDYYLRSLAKKVPGLEATLQPDVNVWGRTDTKDSFSDWALDFANKFILPTNVKVTNRDSVDEELIRVVESTGETGFLPSDGNKYFQVNHQKYTMNARQYTEYSQERGQAAYVAMKDVMASASYKSASDEQKASMLKKAIDAAYKQVNNAWKEKLGAYDK